jgi:leucine dehydrogenase
VSFRADAEPGPPSPDPFTTLGATSACASLKELALGVFEAIDDAGDGGLPHEEVLFATDPVSGLKTIIAIHSTALGPALGGTRFFPYPDEATALADVLRLSRAMTYKAAAAGLDLGGGKAVIIGDPARFKNERLLRAYGRSVDSLGGRYITAEDVGTTAEDMMVIARETKWVTGVPAAFGGSDDPSPATARGVMTAIATVARRLWGGHDLTGRTVAVQGVGKVGRSLVERLTKAGAATVVTDIDNAALDDVAATYGSRIVGLEDIFDVDCDIFAPCALGGALNPETIPRLTCAAVVGSANNQLRDAGDADLLSARGILYAPDFVVNAGGIINITEELRGYSWERAAHAVDGIGSALEAVLDRAEAAGINPHVAAEEIARERIATVGSLRLRRRSGGGGM